MNTTEMWIQCKNVPRQKIEVVNLVEKKPLQLRPQWMLKTCDKKEVRFKTHEDEIFLLNKSKTTNPLLEEMVSYKDVLLNLKNDGAAYQK